ncbi:hypothetical protein [Nostoc sp.]|uniref:hypothetical protein n=1 Tax=Nostoc sp. TaxID=1180 RepID=UPI002FF52490
MLSIRLSDCKDKWSESAWLQSGFYWQMASPRSALLRSPLALAKPSLLNPTNNCWQGNDQNPIDQASQNAGAEHLVKIWSSKTKYSPKVSDRLSG